MPAIPFKSSQASFMSKPHSRELRKGRHSEHGRIYHVRTSTRERRPVFLDVQLGRIVVHGFRFVHERGDVESLAFVIMPDHFHWLITLGPQTSLERVMHDVKRDTARRVNLRRGGVGNPLWQPGYFDRALRAEDDVLAIARYIVMNPIRAGLCQRVGDYPLWDAIWF
jgi:REP element-mobilizing transposase RayT